MRLRRHHPWPSTVASIVWLACVVAVSAGCHAAKPNIVLVVIDTLRADRVGAVAGKAELTPFLDELAASGVTFSRAYAQSSWTLPSVASLLTSRYQSQHGMVNMQSVLSEDEETLTEVLRDAGYTTLGLSANILVSEHTGLQQGFDVLDARSPDTAHAEIGRVAPYERAAALNRRARRALTRIDRKKPLFLYLHYMEPHPPAAPSTAMLDATRGTAKRPDLQTVNANWLLVRFYSPPRLSPPDLAELEIAYNAEVREVDAGLRKLFRWLDARGFLERAIVVVTSDHGEELQEHGLIGHALTLYEEVIHVPLIIKPPAGGDGRLVDEPVSLVDVAPTVLGLAGLQSPPSFNGTSLCDLLGPAADCASSVSGGLPRGTILSELLSASTPGPFEVKHRRALITSGDKFVTSDDADDGFFDLTDDPGELNPEALSPARRTALQRTLQEIVVRASKNATAPSAAQLDDSRRDQLRRLGYAE